MTCLINNKSTNIIEWNDIDLNIWDISDTPEGTMIHVSNSTHSGISISALEEIHSYACVGEVRDERSPQRSCQELAGP